MTATRRYFVALGSNLDDRVGLIRRALAELDASEGLSVRAVAQIWETKPVGPGTGPYLNSAALVEATLEPTAMLERLAAIERSLGRVRVERWGDRRIDLDLVAGFDLRTGTELLVDEGPLELPHPRVHERDFVLQPLIELDPELRVGGRRCADSLASLAPSERTLLRVVAREA